MILNFKQDWQIGEEIGSGGFGHVFAAKSVEVASAVAKFVPKAPGSQRELLFVQMEGVRNIIPVIDSGESADSWVLIMPRAEQTLRSFMNSEPVAKPQAEIIAILLDISIALSELSGKVVHRDIKPENIMFLGGHWCLADFGISRYAEATTAQDTQKFAMSPPYAAPERWREERATISVDIYALGCIAYELATGNRPFSGPYAYDFREQHLHAVPATCSSLSPSLGALINECLYKEAGARPSPANVVARLLRIRDQAVSPGLARLQQAHLSEVEKQGRLSQASSVQQSEAERREALASNAIRGLKTVIDALKGQILIAAPSAKVGGLSRVKLTVSLGPAELEVLLPSVTPISPWASDPPAFQVITHAAIGIRIPPKHGYEGRTHSLWFCDAKEPGHFAWFETAFMISPMVGRSRPQNPFALRPGVEAAKALWTGMAEYQVAWPFTQLDIGEPDKFIEQWAIWFADAVQGRLNSPNMMPEKPCENSWRRN